MTPSTSSSSVTLNVQTTDSTLFIFASSLLCIYLSTSANHHLAVSENPSKHSREIGPILGGILGGILPVIILPFFICWRRRRAAQKTKLILDVHGARGSLYVSNRLSHSKEDEIDGQPEPNEKDSRNRQATFNALINSMPSSLGLRQSVPKAVKPLGVSDRVCTDCQLF